MNLLITGGTGSFGHAMTRRLLAEGAQRIVIYSRDEVKQDAMRAAFGNDPRLRFFLGDVRDLPRLRRALDGVSVVYHAAALKRVPQCEYDPEEAIKTNILGSLNVCNAAIDAGVSAVVALSTDKATAPVNLYGATKLCVEKLVVAANAYAPGRTRLMALRYGNVAGSRGSVIPLWRETRWSGWTMTDPSMTRFWITLSEAVDLARRATLGHGGEVFIPRLPAYTLGDLAEAMQHEGTIDALDRGVIGATRMRPIPPTVAGLRPGEKRHEAMLSEDELALARDYGTHLCLHPTHPWVEQRTDGVPVTSPLTSDTAPRLTVPDLVERLKDV